VAVVRSVSWRSAPARRLAPARHLGELRAHGEQRSRPPTARAGERPTTARSPCASRVRTEPRGRAARQASSRRRLSHQPAAHWAHRRHWYCCGQSRRAACRRRPSRRAMACGEASVRPDASLCRWGIGRPSRCALSAALALYWYPSVYWSTLSLSLCTSSRRARVGAQVGWTARRLLRAFTSRRRWACWSSGRSPRCV